MPKPRKSRLLKTYERADDKEQVPDWVLRAHEVDDADVPGASAGDFDVDDDSDGGRLGSVASSDEDDSDEEVTKMEDRDEDQEDDDDEDDDEDEEDDEDEVGGGSFERLQVTTDAIRNCVADDPVKIKHQNFIVFSFISGEEYKSLWCGDRLYRGDLIKIRGVFKVRENASKFIENTLLPSDPGIAVWMAECFTWTSLDQCAADDDDDDSEHARRRVQSALMGYFENEEIRVGQMRDRVAWAANRLPGVHKKTREFFYDSVRRKEEEKEWKKQARRARKQHKKQERLAARGEGDEERPKSAVINLRSDKPYFRKQRWALVSHMSKDQCSSPSFPNEDMSLPLLKFRGVFETREDAEQHVHKHIIPRDGAVDVDLFPCYEWAGLETDDALECEYVGDQNNFNLGTVFAGYYQNNNDKVSKDPKERRMAAMELRRRLEKQGVPLSEMPYDATLVDVPPEPRGSSQAYRGSSSSSGFTDRKSYENESMDWRAEKRIRAVKDAEDDDDDDDAEDEEEEVVDRERKVVASHADEVAFMGTKHRR